MYIIRIKIDTKSLNSYGHLNSGYQNEGFSISLEEVMNMFPNRRYIQKTDPFDNIISQKNIDIRGLLSVMCDIFKRGELLLMFSQTKDILEGLEPLSVFFLRYVCSNEIKINSKEENLFKCFLNAPRGQCV